VAIWPSIDFTRPFGLVREPERDAILLVNLALEIHVSESVDQLFFYGNEPDVDIFLHQSLLDLAVGDLSSEGLDVFFDRLLGIIDISFTSCLLELGPGDIRSSISDMVTVDLASVLTVISEVACYRLSNYTFIY
jgi:hypothetical protein